MALVARCGKSMTATLRRFVTHGPDRIMAMMVSTPWWEQKPDDQPNRWRHFAGSRLFEAFFSNLLPEQLLSEVDAHSQRRSGGPVAEFACCVDDNDGQPHEFYVESFYNRHDILTLFVEIRQRSARRIVVPTSVTLGRSESMDFLHTDFWGGAESTAVVTLDAQCNVLLVDESNFPAYKRGDAFRYYGGWASRTPVYLTPPRYGHWHVVIDLAGGPGRVRAGVRILKGSSTAVS